MKIDLRICCCTFLAALAVNLLTAGNAGAQSLEDASSIAELKAIILRQQEQLDAQAKAIAELQQALQQQKDMPVGINASAPEADAAEHENRFDVTLYGQINRALMYVDDGNQDVLRHVDPDTSGTRFGILAQKEINDDLKVGGKFEVEYQVNGSNYVSMDVESVDEGVRKRHMDIFLDSSRLGKFSIGQGDTASNCTSESDLSGVYISGIHVGVYDLLSSFTFYNRTAGDYTTDTGTVGDFFNSMDGLSRRVRVRYDSPQFGGLTLSGSATENKGRDLALRFYHTLPQFRLQAAAAIADPGRGYDYNQVNGSFSLRHDSGLSLTMSGGRRNYNDSVNQDDPTFLYTRLAYETDIWPIGSTVFGMDYGDWNDLSHTDSIGDDAGSYGVGIVQNVTDWNTEFYATYRIYTLDRSGVASGYNDFKMFWSGLRFKFRQ